MFNNIIRVKSRSHVGARSMSILYIYRIQQNTSLRLAKLYPGPTLDTFDECDGTGAPTLEGVVVCLYV